jgi:hypothetical protein
MCNERLDPVAVEKPPAKGKKEYGWEGKACSEGKSIADPHRSTNF